MVDELEDQVIAGGILGAEIFLFTDNSTTEAVYFKGNSSTKKLFELMLWSRKIEMDGKLILHVVDVSGSCMIDEGGDGGSSGDFTQGVMTGRPIFNYIPLHLSALERSPHLESCDWSWWDESGRGPLTTLGPEGWFEEGQELGNFLWTPPPAATHVVVE